MATIDLSRSSTDFRKHFTSVRAQMGRVLTDDDHNENERLHGEDMRRSRVDIIGPAGSPDDGFSIQNPAITGGEINFDIVAGTFYLGGNRLVLETTEKFQVQSDWLNMAPADIPAAPATQRYDLVYLESWQQPVSAVEDSELLEVALGGPDTSARIKLMHRVRAFAGTVQNGCTDGWTALAGTWTAAGLGTLSNQAELVVDTKLQVGFVPGPTGDLCTPSIAGGYLGADNQAIRVQLVDPATFTWGFDNAAPLYRVQVGPNALGQMRKITMLTEPRDQAHWPVSAQIVELLPWSAVLPNDERTAEIGGYLARVDASFDPDTSQLTITTDVPAGFGEEWLTRPDANNLKPEFFYMRVWNRGSDTASPLAIPFAGAAVTLGNTGLTVTFSGNDHHPGDYWIIAARPESPNLVVPWLLETGRGPNGSRRWYTPLAVINWDGAGAGQVICDCRDKFPPLTHMRGCCTYTVGDGVHSYGDFTSVQKAINALPSDGGEVCIRSGVYNENLSILNLHDVRLHGCGLHTMLEDGGKAAAPVITVQDSQRIEICGFTILAEAVAGIQLISTAAAEKQGAGLANITIDGMDIAARDKSAIDCRGGQAIVIANNQLEAGALLGVIGAAGSDAGMYPLLFVGAVDVLIERNLITVTADQRSTTPMGGVQIGGGSERVQVRRNLIDGGNGNGITLGSITYVSAGGGVPGGAGGTVTVIGGGFTVDGNGCLIPDPNPGPPNDPNGNPMVPQNDGALLDIRIIDNDILEMGECGISTLRFFQVGLILIYGLQVEANRITRCVQLELGDQPFDPKITLGFGGVSLMSVERFTLRDNFIELNGQSFVDPICGVFILAGRGLVAENNQIVNNGPFVETGKQPTAGPRGGIVIQMARTPSTSLGLLYTGPLIGFSAVRITGNTVVAPLGRALSLTAQGATVVTNNNLTSRGAETQAGTLGAAVSILNLGYTYEIAALLGFSSMALNAPGLVSNTGNEPFVGGEILFSGNQVLLAPYDNNGPVVFTSVELIALDDVEFEDNQCVAQMSTELLIVHGFVLAWSTRMNGNRFEEAPTFGLSGASIAVMNCTTMNQGTRCFAVIGIPSLTVNTANRSLVSYIAVSAGDPDPCLPFQDRFNKAMVSYGFNP